MLGKRYIEESNSCSQGQGPSQPQLRWSRPEGSPILYSRCCTFIGEQRRIRFARRAFATDIPAGTCILYTWATCITCVACARARVCASRTYTHVIGHHVALLASLTNKEGESNSFGNDHSETEIVISLVSVLAISLQSIR